LIEKLNNEFVVTCDYCEDEFNTGYDDFFNAIEYVKNQGWKIVKDIKQDEWYHYCGECKGVIDE
jgi:hypothetical protein